MAKGLKSMQLPSNFYCLGAREAPLDIRHCPPRPGADEMGGGGGGGGGSFPHICHKPRPL